MRTSSGVRRGVTQLNEYREELEGRIESINALIESLQAADSGLEEKIAALDGRLDDQQDWVTATFATLEQYNGLVGDIASIEASIEAVNASITDLEARMKEKIATDIAAGRLRTGGGAAGEGCGDYRRLHAGHRYGPARS